MENDVKIVFRGNLSPSCKKELKNACVRSCILYVIIVLILIVWGIVGYSFIPNNEAASLGFIKYLPYIMAPCGIILCFMVIINAKKGYIEPVCIEIAQDKCVSAEFDDGVRFWSFDDVQKVEDKGECYVVRLKSKRNVSILVCPKNLIVQGTKEEFEDLFSAKMSKASKTLKK